MDYIKITIYDKIRTSVDELFNYVVFGAFLGAIWANSGDDGIGESVLSAIKAMNISEATSENLMYSLMLCGLAYHINRLLGCRFGSISYSASRVSAFLKKSIELTVISMSAYVVCLIFRDGYGLKSANLGIFLLVVISFIYVVLFSLWREFNLASTRGLKWFFSPKNLSINIGFYFIIIIFIYRANQSLKGSA